ncbi:hypothetical protein DL93DRAFT_2170227 [Clavulina sp. PMI_390]|nr:hypothetical protein DL93DRAFT_2170227 [Clavulina sp. PMI_390]
MRFTAFLGAFVVAVAGVRAQLPEYSQCGGETWTGPTVCAEPFACVVLNAWYSECLPYVAGETTTPVTGQYYRK